MCRFVRVVGSENSAQECFLVCIETYNFEPLTEGIGRGYWKIHLYSGLTHFPVGLGLTTLSGGVLLRTETDFAELEEKIGKLAACERFVSEAVRQAITKQPNDNMTGDWKSRER